MSTFLLLFLVALWPLEAFAYIDPGSGSMLLQLLLGGIAGLFVAGKLFWVRIAGKFSRGKKGGDEESDV